MIALRVMVGCHQCGHIACVCRIVVDHAPSCRFRISATCAVPIECDHGRDVCPTCDPCTCRPRQPRVLDNTGRQL